MGLIGLGAQQDQQLQYEDGLGYLDDDDDDDGQHLQFDDEDDDDFAGMGQGRRKETHGTEKQDIFVAPGAFADGNFGGSGGAQKPHDAVQCSRKRQAWHCLEESGVAKAEVLSESGW